MLDGDPAVVLHDDGPHLVDVYTSAWSNRPTNRGCLGWWLELVSAACELGRRQAVGRYPSDVGEAELARGGARLAAGYENGAALVVLVDREPVCDVCGLDALSLKLIARNDRPRRRTLEVDGCRVAAAYVCRVCEGKVEASPSERGWSERTGFGEGVTGRGGPDDHKAQALGAEFSTSLAEALEGAEHGDHVREACCFDGWPGASAVWLGYALGRFLLWLQGAELRPLRDLAREAWDPHDEGAAPYFFDAGVRHG